jgi:hypothetical protein
VDSPKKINSNLKVIAEMVVKDYLPLSFVEGDCFLNLMNIIVTFLPKDHEWDLMSDLSTVLSDLSEVITYTNVHVFGKKTYRCQKFTLLCVDYLEKV